MPVQNQPRNRGTLVDRNIPQRNPNPVPTTSSRHAMWSALIALAIVVVMFGVFYDISGRTNPMASGSAPTTATQTIGQSSANQQGGR